jgi:hypothetical protein
MMKPIQILLLILVTISCTQRIKVPINRMMTPEVIGGGAEIEFQRIGYAQSRLDFTGGRTDNPLGFTSVVSNRTLYMAAGVSQNVDLFVRIPQESSSLLGLKVQLIGVPSKIRNNSHQFAFTVAVGSERDSFEGAYEIDLKSDVRDLGLIYGYRLNHLFIGYTSVSLSSYHFRGDVKDGGGVLIDDKIDYEAQNILGGQMGFEFGGETFSLKLELAAQKIKWTNTEEELLYSSGLAFKYVF